jgi:hypothetical protein
MSNEEVFNQNFSSLLNKILLIDSDTNNHNPFLPENESGDQLDLFVYLSSGKRGLPTLTNLRLLLMANCIAGFYNKK